MPHYMLLTVSNYFNIGGGTKSEATFRTTTYQVSEDLSLIRGKHQMSVGGKFCPLEIQHVRECPIARDIYF